MNTNTNANAQQKREQYQSQMRVIGYYLESLKNNYEEMRLEDFQLLSSQVTRTLQDASMNLNIQFLEPEHLVEVLEPLVEPEPEPLVELEPEPLVELEPEPLVEPEPEPLVGVQIQGTRLFQTPPSTPRDAPTVLHNVSQYNVTTIRGTPNMNELLFNEEIMDLLSHDEPMTLNELNDDGEDSDSYSDSDSSYQEYISIKTKPKLMTKCFSKKDGLEKSIECIICTEEYNLHHTLTLGCGHEFCKECVCDHFHHSVENQPYSTFYACPICRADVKQVRVNYTRMDARDKPDLMNGHLVRELKTWCR